MAAAIDLAQPGGPRLSLLIVGLPRVCSLVGAGDMYLCVDQRSVDQGLEAIARLHRTGFDDLVEHLSWLQYYKAAVIYYYTRFTSNRYTHYRSN